MRAGLLTTEVCDRLYIELHLHYKIANVIEGRAPCAFSLHIGEHEAFGSSSVTIPKYSIEHQGEACI